jgi:hypothetical protein
MIKQFFKSILGSRHVDATTLETAPANESQPEMSGTRATEYMNQGGQFLTDGELDHASNVTVLPLQPIQISLKPTTTWGSC